MAKATQVILVFDNGKTRTYDTSKIDSIFFDDAKARCFAKHCLPDDSDTQRKLDDAIGARPADPGGDAPGGGNPGAAEGGSGGTGGSTAQAVLAEPTPATATMEVTAQDGSDVCIHMTSCDWDCDPTND